MKIKFSRKIPPINSQRHDSLKENNWVQLKEPGNILSAIVASLPLMILNIMLTIAIFAVVQQPVTLADFGIVQDGFQINIDLRIIVGFILLLVFHELLHLILVPDFVSSKKTYAGITPLGGFVYSEEEIQRSRYLMITIAPFLIISVIIPLVFGVLGILSQPLKILILLNSMASSVDLLTFILILTQVPTGSYLTSNGTRTYWKK